MSLLRWWKSTFVDPQLELAQIRLEAAAEGDPIVSFTLTEQDKFELKDSKGIVLRLTVEGSAAHPKIRLIYRRPE